MEGVRFISDMQWHRFPDVSFPLTMLLAGDSQVAIGGFGRRAARVLRCFCDVWSARRHLKKSLTESTFCFICFFKSFLFKGQTRPVTFCSRSPGALQIERSGVGVGALQRSSSEALFGGPDHRRIGGHTAADSPIW